MIELWMNVFTASLLFCFSWAMFLFLRLTKLHWPNSKPMRHAFFMFASMVPFIAGLRFLIFVIFGEYSEYQ